MNIYGLDVELTKERKELMDGGWERGRMQSMLANINHGDVVFDIGAEQGDISVMLAKKSGKIILFEPSPMMWPHIRDNFNRNGLIPLDCYVGFASDVTKESPENLNYKDEMVDGYPKCAYEKLNNVRGFRHLHEEFSATKQITVDDYCERTKIYPHLVTIDVEGSEFNVLQGMIETIDKIMPIIYVSVHPDFLYMNYGKFFNDIGNFFNERGYKSDYLGFDHEMHMVYYKKSLIKINEVL